MVKGFQTAVQKIAATRLGERRSKGRRTLADSKARLREAAAALKINRVIRRFLNWLHRQPWYGIAADMRNPVQTQVRVSLNLIPVLYVGTAPCALG
jgi:hypothetical protein